MKKNLKEKLKKWDEACKSIDFVENKELLTKLKSHKFFFFFQMLFKVRFSFFSSQARQFLSPTNLFLGFWGFPTFQNGHFYCLHPKWKIRLIFCESAHFCNNSYFLHKFWKRSKNSQFVFFTVEVCKVPFIAPASLKCLHFCFQICTSRHFWNWHKKIIS